MTDNLTSPLHDELRARIAQILYGDGDEIPWPRATQLADLIIWETGLQQEWGCPTAGHHGCRCSQRYTTDWNTPDQ